MRCPKCGYNSFDHLDSCKKCGKDLVEFKERYKVRSVLFPGQMKPSTAADVEEIEAGSSAAAAVAAVATASVATAATAAVSDGLAEADDFTEATETSSSDSDDFGFDFMGESAEEEDLSFDELFEDAPTEEDVEETLPSPHEEAAEAETDIAAPDGFAFDASDADEDEVVAALSDEAELEDDFGFDLEDSSESSAAEVEVSTTSSGQSEDLSSDDFELPPADEDEFSFNSDEVEFEDTDEDDEELGTKEGPKDPFDLPGSPQDEESPEQDRDLSLATPEPLAALREEPDLLIEDSFAAEELVSQVEQREDPDLTQRGYAEPEPLPDEAPPLAAVAVDFAVEEESAALAKASESEPERTLHDLEPQTVSADEVSEPPPVVAAPMETSHGVLAAGAVAASAAVLAEGNSASTLVAAPAAVTSDGEEADQELRPSLAGRVGAFCCDLVLLATVGFCFVVAAEMAMAEAGDGLFPSLETLIDLSVPYFLVLFFLAFGYFTLFHFLAGQTPGKMLAGLRVETVDGEPLVFSQAFLRSVGGLLQLLPAGLGYLAILFSEDRRGWNDQLAGTRLIALSGQAEEN